ncbi:thioesterase [Rhodobacteraceae bacterium 63075]|nr:thioesterase [Rhodobacteraceae bacterium 63075]
MTAPFLSEPMTVLPEWIDYNGHLNMAYYNVLLDQGVDQLWSDLSFGPDYRERTGCTTYSAEYHIRYLRELHEGDKVRTSFQLLDFDSKRFHFAQSLIHEEGWVAAQGEGLGLHVDQSGPRVAPMPADIHAKFQALLEEHAKLPQPDFVGRPMGIHRKS